MTNSNNVFYIHMYRNNSCPDVAVDEDGFAVDARLPGMTLTTATAAYRRFFGAHCSLQILWSHEHGYIVNENYKTNKTLPFDDMLDVVKLMLRYPPQSVDELRATIASVEVFNVVTKSMPINTLLLRPAKSSDASSRPSVVTFVGDALYAGKYRKTERKKT